MAVLRHGRLEARPMESADAAACAHLWISNYRRIALSDGGAAIPDLWIREPSRVREFISARAERGFTLTAGTDIVGYIVYDAFSFHGRRAAFCPALSHGVEDEHRQWGYRLLYRAASAAWVAAGSLDHYLQILYRDQNTCRLFFDLGFGRYVVDAYRGVEDIAGTDGVDCDVRAAGPESFADVRMLMDLATEFYREAPLFLVRERDTDEELRDLLTCETCKVWLARVGGAPVGLMNVRPADAADPITLADSKTALLDPLGAYIKPEYRNRGIGDALLARCVEWSRQQGLIRIHVDYEGANVFASAYWRKHFSPLLYSLKRSVHPDAIC